MAARGVVILALSLLAGGVAAHLDARLRKPLLTPLALCATATAVAAIVCNQGRRNSVKVDRGTPSPGWGRLWLGCLAAAVCLTAFLGEGWRVYRGAVLSIPVPVDQLADAARSAAVTHAEGDPAAAKLVAELKAGLARREELHRERGSLVDHTRFRWRNFEALLPLSQSRSVTMLLLAGECLVALLAGVVIGGALVRPRGGAGTPRVQ